MRIATTLYLDLQKIPKILKMNKHKNNKFNINKIQKKTK